ncbi:MAG: Gmad2 immunoglobulin-like domain-containing protein [Moorellaceae bacterium]
MRRILIALILAVSLFGCNLANKAERADFQDNSKLQDTITKGQDTTSAPKGTDIGRAQAGDQGRANSSDTPTSSDLNADNGCGTYPKEVSDLIETMKTIEGGSWVIIGDQTFMVVSRGQKPTAGYGVTIKDVKTEGDRAVVYVLFTDPDKDSAVAEVITYPYAVQAIKGRFTEVEFQEVNRKIEYIARVIGLKDQYLARGNGNIRLLSQQFYDSKIVITGIARVFEATVNYELQDAQGEVLQQGYTMAASGAPDWGFFQLELNNCPPATAKIKIYQVSPQDGSHQDVVTVAYIK